MDPASVAALVGVCANIIKNAASFLTSLDSVITQIRDATLDIAVLRNHCQLVGLTCDRLRVWLEADGDQLKESERAFVVGAIDVCNQLLDKLSEVAQKCSCSSKDGEEKAPGLWKIVRFIFSQPQLAKYEKAIQSQLSALNLIVQTLHLESGADRRKALREPKNRNTIKKAISIGSDTSSDLSSLSSQLDSESDAASSDSGYSSLRGGNGEDRGGVVGDEEDLHPDLTDSGLAAPLTMNNLEALNTKNPQRPLSISVLNEDYASRGAGSSSHQSRDGRYAERDSSAQRPTAGPAAAAAAPDGDDNPDSSDSSDSDPTEVGGDNPPNAPSEASQSSIDSAYMVRDGLRRIRGRLAEGDDEERMRIVRRSLQELCRQMGLLGNPADLPDGLFQEIERLLSDIQRDLRKFYNEDERIARGTDVAVTNVLGETALHIAARKEMFDEVTRLINLGASVRDVDNEGKTPLQALLHPRYRNSSRLTSAASDMLSHGAEPNLRLRDGSTVLHAVASNADVAVLEALLMHGADRHARNHARVTPLLSVCKESYYAAACTVSCVEALLGEDDEPWGGDDIQDAIHHALEAVRRQEDRIFEYNAVDGNRYWLESYYQWQGYWLHVLELLLKRAKTGQPTATVNRNNRDALNRSRLLRLFHGSETFSLLYRDIRLLRLQCSLMDYAALVRAVKDPERYIHTNENQLDIARLIIGG